MGRAEFTANRVIQTNGVNAYQPGDLVWASAVDNLGLSVGADGDVMPVEDTLLPEPAKSASRGDWAVFALSRGLTADEVDGMTKADLVAAFTEPAEE